MKMFAEIPVIIKVEVDSPIDKDEATDTISELLEDSLDCISAETSFEIDEENIKVICGVI